MPKFIRRMGRSGATHEDTRVALVVRPSAPMRRIAAGGIARVALAACVLALAALVVTSTGAGGLGGALGSLFGFHSASAAQPTTRARPIVTHAVKGVVTPVSRQRSTAKRAPATHRPSSNGRRTTSAPPTSPPHSLAPQSSPQPIPTPTQPPPALPAEPPPGVVGGAGAAVGEVGKALPPPEQPVVGQAVEAIGQVCGVLEGCP